MPVFPNIPCEEWVYCVKFPARFIVRIPEVATLPSFGPAPKTKLPSIFMSPIKVLVYSCVL